MPAPPPEPPGPPGLPEPPGPSGRRHKRLYAEPDEARLAELADRQEGVVHVRQLHELGYTRDQIDLRCRRRRLYRKHRGVYAVGRSKLTLRGRRMAAVLACGPRAALSHRDAAALHGLRYAGTGLIHVSAPGRHNIPGIRCHGRRRAIDRTVVDGIPVTSVAQTLLDLAEAMSSQDFTATLEQAQREDKIDLLAIEAVIAASPGHRGIKPLRAELAALDDEHERIRRGGAR